jgi:hypothetical protein
MDWALNKFKTRKESEQRCQRTTEEEETIIALQAQVNNLMVHQKKPTYYLSIQQASPMEMEGRTTSRDSTRKARVKASQEQVTF